MQVIYVFTSGSYSSYSIEAHYLVPDGFDPKKIDQAIEDATKANKEYFVEYQRQKDSISWNDYFDNNPYPEISVVVFKFLDDNGFVELDVTEVELG